MPESDLVTVRWKLPRGFEDLAVLPIAFLTGEGDIVASGVSGEDIEVPHGTYLLSVKLPSGRTVISREKAQIGEIVALPSLKDELDRHLDPDRYRVSASSRTPDALTLDFAFDADAAMTALHLRGDLYASLGQGRAIAQPLSWAVPPHLGSGRHGLIQVSQDDQVLVLPGEKNFRIVLLPFDMPADVSIAQTGRITIDLDLKQNRVRFLSAVCSGTNLLAEYVEHGLLDDSSSISAAVLHRAPLPNEDDASLLGVLLSAYVQLRNSTLDMLEPSLAQIAHTADFVPDYWAIRAELLSRQGHHDEAVTALSRCIDHSCPWFRSGLGYVLQRMSLYLDADDDADVDSFKLPSATHRRFSAHLSAMKNLATRLDPRELVTTFVIEKNELLAIVPSAPGTTIQNAIVAGIDDFHSSQQDTWLSIPLEVFS